MRHLALILCVLVVFANANTACSAEEPSTDTPAAPFGYAEITVMQDGVFEGYQAGDTITFRVGVRLAAPTMLDENPSARVGYGTTRPGIPALVRDLKLTPGFSTPRIANGEPFLYLTTGKTLESVKENSTVLLQMEQSNRMSQITGRCAKPTKEPGSQEGELITSTISVQPEIELTVLTDGWVFGEIVDPVMGAVAQITLCQEE